MKIRAKITPASKKEEIRELPDGRLDIRVRAKAEKGLANKAAIEALSSHYGVPAEKIRIISGHKSRNKTISIDN